MTVDGPTKAKETTSGKWATHPVIAGALKFVVMAAPTAVSFASTYILTRNFPAYETSLHIIVWWLIVIAVGLAALVGTDRVMRRVLPLVALFRLSLIFPDKAPSRFSIAMRTGTTKQLQRQVEEIKLQGLPTDATRHAELMLQMVAALSVHDRMTRGHCERVRAYTDMISEEIGLSELDAAKLRWAALLHDVGKLFVPAEILNKEGQPTEDEWEILKSHTWQGDKLIGPLKPWLGEWASAVGSHHERWDGGGYPNGLAGENIHIGARIVSVADTFDVITSKRSYKPAISADKARAEIARCAGSQFDPKIARAFLNIGLGRLRFAIGPLSWLANIPAAGQAAVAPVASPLATAAVAIAATSAAVATGNVDAVINHSTEPDVIAFVDETPQDIEAAPTTTSPATPTPTTVSARPTTTEGAAPADVGPSVDDIRVELNEDGQATATVSVETGSLLATLRITSDGSLGSATLSTTSFASGQTGFSTLRFVGASDQSGIDSVVYEVCDTQGRCDSGSATVTINPVNDAPALRTIPDQSFHAGDTVSISPSAVDVEGDVLTFQATGLPDGVEIDSRSGEMTGVITPETNVGDQLVTVSVTDSGTPSRTSTTTFNLRFVPAHHPVAIPVSASTEEDENLEITLQATSFDGDLTFSIVTPPTSGTLSEVETPTPGELATETLVTAQTVYTPDADTFGSDTIEFEICDRHGRCDRSSANLTVVPVNDPPTIEGIDTVTASVLETVSIAVSTADVDSESVDVTATGLPDGLSVSADMSEISGAVSNGLAGTTHEVVVTATDDATPTASTTMTFEIVVEKAAPLPMAVFSTTDEDTPATIAVTAQTESGNLTYSIPTGQTYQGVATFAIPTTTTATDGQQQLVSADLDFTPAADSTATETIQYLVCDEAAACAAQTLTIEIQPINDAPRVSPLSFTTPEDTDLIVTDAEVVASAIDAEGDDMFVSWGLTATGSVTDTGDSVTYTPEADASGTVDLPVTVCDANGACTSAVATITIVAVNDAPVLQPIDSVSTTIGGTVSVSMDASDTENDTLTYQAAGLPDGLTINGTTGAITGTVANPQSERQVSVSVTVTDGDATDSETFTITIEPVLSSGATLTSPTQEDTPVTGRVWGSTDRGNLTVTLHTPPTNGSVTALPAATTTLTPLNLDTYMVDFTYTPNPGFHGTDSVILKLCDAATGLSCVVSTSLIDVAPVNDRPTIDAVADQAIAGGVDFDLAITAADPDGDTLTYSATDLPAGLTINSSTGLISGTPESGNEEETRTASITVADNGSPTLSASTTVNFIFDRHSVAAEAGQLIITEVLYQEPSFLQLNEFIEITNVGTTPINLQSFSVADYDHVAGGMALADGFGGSFAALDAHGNQSILQPGQVAIVWITDPTTGGAIGLPYGYTTTTADLEYSFEHPLSRLHPGGDEVWLTKGSEIVGFVGWGSTGGDGTNERAGSPSATTGLWTMTNEAALANTSANTSISLASNAGWGDSACWEITGSGTASANGCAGAQTTIDTDPFVGSKSPGLANFN